MLLVGGFGSAPYLRKRLEEGLWEGLQLLQAPEVFTVEAPSAAVLTGEAFGSCKHPCHSSMTPCDCSMALCDCSMALEKVKPFA